MKKIIVLSLIFSLCFAGLVLAQEQSQNQNKKQETVETYIADRKQKAIQEIDRRINSLNQTVAKVNSMKFLNAEQKNVLAVDIQKEISSLDALKTKIQIDTDKETLKDDIKSIVAAYRIYALYQPKVIIMAHGDKIIEIANLIESKTGDTEVKSLLSEVKNKTNEAIAIVSVLEPAGYPDNKTELKKAKELLKEAREQLVGARQLMKGNATP